MIFGKITKPSCPDQPITKSILPPLVSRVLTWSAKVNPRVSFTFANMGSPLVTFLHLYQPLPEEDQELIAAYFEPSMTEDDRKDLYTTVGNSLLVKRVGEAEDIAQAFLYLMKQQFGTGQNIVIDGGMVLV